MADPRPVRLQLSRKAGFRLGPNARSVARPGLFGNPWIVGALGRLLAEAWQQPFEARIILDFDRTLTAAAAADAFRAWLAGERPLLPTEPSTAILMAVEEILARRRRSVLDMLPRLAGCDLACWCRTGAPCHADVLLELANTPLSGPSGQTGPRPGQALLPHGEKDEREI